MNLLIVILIELGAVAGTGFLAYRMISKAVGQAKQAIIQDVALKALEAKTGISSNTVKSLVGEKPMASDPGTAIGGIANAVAGNGNLASKLAGQLMGKMPRPVKFAAGGIMTGIGATAAVGEALGKAGLRKISPHATKIANGAKLRFTNSKVGQKLIEGRDKLKTKVNSVKTGINEFGDGIKKGLNTIGDGIRNSKVIRGAVGGIRYAKKIKNDVSEALADTWGYRSLMKPGEKLIADAVKLRHGGSLRLADQPARDPLLTNLNSRGKEKEKMHTLGELTKAEEIEKKAPEKYKSESLREFIKAKREGNQKITGSYYAKQYAEAVDELGKQENSSQAMLKQRMMLDLIRNTSKNMDKDTLLNATNTMYSNYLEKQNSGMEEARKAAEENYDKVALETVSNFFGKHAKKSTALGDRLDEYIKTTYDPKDGEKKQIKEETWAEIASNLDGKVARTILTNEEREKIKKEISDKQERNVQLEAIKIENEQVKSYRAEHGGTLQEARVQVEKQNTESNYKQALEDAIKSMNLNSTANINTSGESRQNNTNNMNNTNNTNTTNNTVTNQQIVQQTTMISSENQAGATGQQVQQVSAGTEPTEQQARQVSAGTQSTEQQVQQVSAGTQYTEQQVQQVSAGTQTQVSDGTQTTEQVVQQFAESYEMPKTSARLSGNENRNIERIVETTGSNSSNDANSAKILKEQEERMVGKIANEVTNQLGEKIVPFTNAIEKSYAWLDKLGNGDLNKGIEKMAKAVEKINGTNENEDINIKMTKTMEKMFKDMGGGDVENGAKYLRQAIENLNKGSRDSIANTEYDDEIIYSIAESIKEYQNKGYISAGSNLGSPSAKSRRGRKPRTTNRRKAV